MDIDLNVNSSIGVGTEAHAEKESASQPPPKGDRRAKVLAAIGQLRKLKYDESLRAIPPRADALDTLERVFSDDGLQLGALDIAIAVDNCGLVSLGLEPSSVCLNRMAVISSPCSSVYDFSLFNDAATSTGPPYFGERVVYHGPDCPCFKSMIRQINDWLTGKTPAPEPTPI